MLEDKGVLYMDFSVNQTPVEIIKEGAFGGTSILVLMESGTEIHGKTSVERYWSEVLILRLLWRLCQ